MSKISNSSTNKQSHKRCQHLEKQSIAHFSTFFDEKEKGQGYYMIVYENRLVQFGQNKGDTMGNKGTVLIDKKVGLSEGRIIGSYHDSFTGYIYLYDQNSVIYKLNFRNFLTQEKFLIFESFEGLKILNIFSWVENQQSFLFIFHKKGVVVISSKHDKKYIDFPVQIWKVGILETQKLTKDFKQFCSNQNDETIVCSLILADKKFPLILTKFHILELIKNEDPNKILTNSITLRQNFYDDQQYTLNFPNIDIKKNTFTSMVISKKYLILGDCTGRINMFTYVYVKNTQVCLQLQKVILQGKNIQGFDLDYHYNLLAVSTDEKILFIKIDQFVRKSGKSLVQKEQKNLNVLRWTKMGKLFLVQVSKQRIGSVYLYLSEFAIEP